MKKRTETFTKDCDAISEIIGELMMITIAVIAFGLLVVIVFSYEGPADRPQADIDGWVNAGTNTVYFRHGGGELIDAEDLKIMLNLNGTSVELSPADLALIYGKPGWGLGDTIEIDTLDEWGITIGEDDYVGATIVHTGAGVVIQTGTLLGEGVVPTATATATATATPTPTPTPTLPPTVTLNSPPDGDISQTGSVTFQYTPNDADSGIAFCSLIINGVLNQTDNNVTDGAINEFVESGLSDGVYTWCVNCTDDSPSANVGVSENRDLTVGIPVCSDWSNSSKEAVYDISGNNNGWKIQVQDDYAYLIRWNGNPDFIVFNISDPANPTLSGSLDIPSIARNIAVSGDYAYIACGDNNGELQIVDISNPSSPGIVSELDLSGNGDVYGVYISENTAYVTRESGSNPIFAIVDVSNPESPVLTGSIDSSEISGNVYEVVVLGDYAYLATSGNELYVVDMSTPSLPTVAASYDLPGGSNAESIDGFGSTIVLGRQNGDVYLFDVSTPSSPVVLGSYNDFGDDIHDISLGNDNNYAFLASDANSAEFQVVDISNSSAPVIISSLNLNGDLNGVAYSADSDRVFAAGEHNDEELVVIAPGPCDAPPTSGPVSLWKFDEGAGSTAYDSIDGNDGKIYGATWTTGINGSALSFDGADDYVTIDYSSDLALDHDYSVEFWIYPTDATTPWRTSLTRKNQFTCSYIGDDKVRVHLNGYANIDSTATAPRNTWTQIIFTFKNSPAGDDLISLYIDGKPDGKIGPTWGTPNNPHNPITVGGNPGVSYFNGKIDEIRIYNKALNDEEVQTSYNALKPTVISEWHLNEGSGGIAYDSADGNDGKIDGAKWTAGVYGSALSFDGKNDCVIVPNSDNLNPADEITIEAWASTTEHITSKVVDKGDGKGYDIALDKHRGWKGGVYIDGEMYKVDWGAKKPVLGQWYYLVLTYDGSAVRLYVDGVEKDSESASFSFKSNSNDLSIGSVGGKQKFFSGAIDEVAVYGKALSPEEIKERYTSAKLGSGVKLERVKLKK